MALMKGVSKMPIDPEEEKFKITEDYPGFVVHDGRAWGAITLGPTRLGLWAVIQGLVNEGYAATVDHYPTLPEDATADEIGWFLKDLLEQRREFGRLLCVLADVERRERERLWAE